MSLRVLSLCVGTDKAHLPELLVASLATTLHLNGTLSLQQSAGYRPELHRLVIGHLVRRLHLLVDLALTGRPLRITLILSHLPVDLLIVNSIDLRIYLRNEAFELIIVRLIID